MGFQAKGITSQDTPILIFLLTNSGRTKNFAKFVFVTHCSDDLAQAK
jgi:hypothetical protein